MWILKRITTSRGNYYINICIPRSVLPRAATGIDDSSEYFKCSAEITSATGRYRQNP